MISLWEQIYGDTTQSDALKELNFDELIAVNCEKKISFFDLPDKHCIEIIPLEKGHNIKTSYFIGVDWLIEKKLSLYIAPKLNKDDQLINYLFLLFNALKDPEIFKKYTDNLFEIKFDKPYIEIEQSQDLLTPLLIVQFLRVVEDIVKKGLKKSYYKVEENLYSRTKGKILAAKTIKHNLLKNKILNTYCGYDEFGFNGLENRLIKKALTFVRQYMPAFEVSGSNEFIGQIYNYVMPAFHQVSEDVSLTDIKQGKPNILFKEYTEAIRLSKLILKRFGYNICNVEKESLRTPPFWIDMSKLFELYVLSILKQKYPGQVEYQPQGNFGEPDYLLAKEKVIIDAKYKTYYNFNEFRELSRSKKHNIASDIRQISGYGRDKKILEKIGINKDSFTSHVPKCLIIYPDMQRGVTKHEEIAEASFEEIEEFSNFQKLAVKLPVIEPK